MTSAGWLKLGTRRATRPAMLWNDLTDQEKALVFEVLEREADRLERDAVQLEKAAKQLGRPSLVERTEVRANAFRAAIEALGGPRLDQS